MPWPPITNQQREQILKMRAQGNSFPEIAASIGLKAHRVRRFLAPTEPSNLDEGLEKRIVRMRKDGYSLERIAWKVGHSVEAIRKALGHRATVPLRGAWPGVPKPVTKKALRLRREGCSYRFIAQKLGISAATAFRIAQKGRLPAQLPLVRKSGHHFGAVLGTCKASNCKRRHGGSGFCSDHLEQHKAGRLDANGHRIARKCEYCQAELSHHRGVGARHCRGCAKIHNKIMARLEMQKLLDAGRLTYQKPPKGNTKASAGTLLCRNCGKRYRKGSDKLCNLCEKLFQRIERVKKRRHSQA